MQRDMQIIMYSMEKWRQHDRKTTKNNTPIDFGMSQNASFHYLLESVFTTPLNAPQRPTDWLIQTSFFYINFLFGWGMRGPPNYHGTGHWVVAVQSTVGRKGYFLYVCTNSLPLGRRSHTFQSCINSLVSVMLFTFPQIRHHLLSQESAACSHSSTSRRGVHFSKDACALDILL